MKKSFLSSRIIFFLFICQNLFPDLVIGQWSKPLNISPNAVSALTNESMGSCIGVSGDTVHVVYADRKSSTRGAIYYTKSVNTGLNWSAPVPITSISGNSWNSAIAVNGSNIHVVWRNIDTLTQRRSSHYKHSIDGGKTWAAEIVLDSTIADWPAVAVSGNHVYVANDIVTAASPYNTEIYFISSSNNGVSWTSPQQITFATGRSEDEAIIAQGSDVFMSWNDNRNGQMQIFYKHSGDYGKTWDPEVAVAPPFGYGTMVWRDGANIDIAFAGASAGKYQTYLVQSTDTGKTWGIDMNLTRDTFNAYYYPDLVRDGNDLHLTYVKVGTGGQYLHSSDGGKTWDKPFNMGTSSITPFIAYSGCMLHVIIPDSGHVIYLRNPTGNNGAHCVKVNTQSTYMNENSKILIYPNPFSTQTTIEINSDQEPKVSVLKVYDIIGHELINHPIEKNKMIFQRDQLVNGIYFYKIFQNKLLIGNGKMVIE